MAKKLNSMRFLEQHNIPYEIIEFDSSIHDAQGVANFASVSSKMVYKTLVTLPDDGKRKKPMLVLIDADCELDLKKFAKEAGYKKVRMANHQEAENLTRLKVGGISALALTAKNWDVYVDEEVIAQDEILVSAGQRGLNLRISAQQLINVLGMKIIPCSKPIQTTSNN